MKVPRSGKKRHWRQSFYAVAFAACPAGFIVWNKQSRIVAWNPAAERIFGWTAAEAQAQPSPHFLVPGNIWPFVETIFVQLLEMEKPTDSVNENMTRSGQLILCEWNNIPMRDGKGQLSGFVSIVHDISQRIHAQQEMVAAHQEAERAREELEDAYEQLSKVALRANELLVYAEYEAHQKSFLLSAIPSILISVDATGRINQWNTAAETTFQIPAVAMIGKPLQCCGINWDSQPILHAIQESQRKNEPSRIDDVRFTSAVGQEGFLGLSVTPLCDENGLSTGVLLLAADITRRKLMEAQLAQARKLESIGHLAAGVAHEINTPVQYIGDNIRFLIESAARLHALHDEYERLLQACKQGQVDEAVIEKVEAAIENAEVAYLLQEIPRALTESLEGIQRVTGIVQAMKEFSHPGTVAKTGVDLNHTIESTILVARNEWKYVAEVVTEFASPLPLIYCYPADLNQVILNLIVNAAHAIEDMASTRAGSKGRITISTAFDGEWAEIRVQDTGSGIPESIRHKIFDPFFTTKEVGRGTGQGLAIAHHIIVEKHQGTIHVESREGEGSTFVLRFPSRAPELEELGEELAEVRHIGVQ